jgi:hypothetical protein
VEKIKELIAYQTRNNKWYPSDYFCRIKDTATGITEEVMLSESEFKKQFGDLLNENKKN